MLKERGFTPLEIQQSKTNLRSPKKGDLSLTGFTLLEVLLATLITAVGVTALVWAFSSGLSATTDIENVDLALNIAQAKMEEIKNTEFASIATSAPPASADANFPRFSTGVVVTGNNPKQVVVKVEWNVKGGSTDITLTTVVANY